MEKAKLSEGEWKVMNLIWNREPVIAKTIAEEMEALSGWKANTTYTVLIRLVKKGVIERKDPDYTITSLVSRKEMQQRELENMLNLLFDGSKSSMFSAFLDDELSKEEIEGIKEILKEHQ